MRRVALLLALLAPLPATAAPQAVVSSPAATYDFTVGALKLTAVQDGHADHLNDSGVLSPKEGVAKALASAGLPTDRFTLNYGPLLVRDGERVVLIDTGIGPRVPSPAPPGQLRFALARAGIAPASVTDIVISHAHFDHIGGLLTLEGKSAFPNARLHITKDAWDALGAHSTPALIAAIEPRLALIPADGRITAHIRTVALPGHAPGHIGVEITSEGQTLLYASDVMHHYIASVAAPDLGNAYDSDAGTAKATRLALLARAADRHLLLYAPHFPFPALGHIVRDGATYAWVPVTR